MIAPGELTIHVGADATGRTRITTLRQRYPQRVTTPLAFGRPVSGCSGVVVQSPSGGTFSDDDLRTTVVCAPGSHLVLTTQSATQVFAGDGRGRHQLRFTVHTGAVLEYIPKTLIPQSGSQFTQTVDVDVAEGGRYIGWEAVAAGRIAHGERFRYAGVDTAITVRSGSRVIARDRQRFTPDAADALDGDYVATQLAVTPGLPPALESARAALTDLSGVRAGASELPHGAGLFTRMTADRAPELRRAQQALHTAVRGCRTDQSTGKERMNMHADTVLGSVTDSRFAGRTLHHVEIGWETPANTGSWSPPIPVSKCGSRCRAPRFCSTVRWLPMTARMRWWFGAHPSPAIVVRFADNTGQALLLLGHLLGNQHAPIDVDEHSVTVPLFTSADAARQMLADLGVNGQIHDAPMAPSGWSRTSADHHAGHHH